jgi:hypothetical protein
VPGFGFLLSTAPGTQRTAPSSVHRSAFIVSSVILSVLSILVNNFVLKNRDYGFDERHAGGREAGGV